MDDPIAKVDYLLELAEAGITLSQSARMLLKLLRDGMTQDEIKLICSEEMRDALIEALADVDMKLMKMVEIGGRGLRKLRPH